MGRRSPAGRGTDIALFQSDSDPVVIFASDIKVAVAIHDVADLLVLVQMLVEKRLDLCLVRIAESLWRDGDFVAIFVVALFGYPVDVCHVAEVVCQDPEICQVLGVDAAARVVWLALVALCCAP